MIEKIILRLLDDREWRRLVPRIIMALIAFGIFAILMTVILFFVLLEKGMMV